MRRLRRILLVLALLLVGAVLLSPWWIPVPARRILAGQGVTFDRYERPRLDRMALTNVRFARPGAGEFTAARIEADMPLLFLLRHQFSRPGPVRIETWHYIGGGAAATTAASSSATTAPQECNPIGYTPAGGGGGGDSASGDWMQLRARLGGIRATLAEWLPSLHASDGKITWPTDPDGGIRLPSVSYRADAVSTRIEASALDGRGHAADVTIAWQTDADSLALNLTGNSEKLLRFLREHNAIAPAAPPSGAALRLSLVSTAAEIAARLHFLNQTAALDARFGPGSWLPVAATLDIPALALPASALQLAPDYARVDAVVRADWRDNRFTVMLDARGIPAAAPSSPSPTPAPSPAAPPPPPPPPPSPPSLSLSSSSPPPGTPSPPPGTPPASPGAPPSPTPPMPPPPGVLPTTSGVPPLTLALRASGDTAQISIDRLDLLLPGTSAHLDAPIVIGRDRRLRSGASRFTLESDFSRLPWLDATGRLAGKITLEAPDAALDQLPRIQARLQAAGLHFRALDDITVTRADIDLAQQGSLTRITRAELTLADGNTARLDGGYDHATRAFAGLNIRATIIPAALARFFPAGAGGGDGGIGTGGIGTGGTGSGGTGSGGGAAAPLDFETATLEATLDGPLKNPTHHGALAVSNLRRAPLKPLTLRATWTGTGAAADADLAIHAAAGATTATTATTAATGTAAATTTAGGTGTGIAAAGTEIYVSAKLASTHAELTRLTYRHAAVERLRLTAPARIAWEPALDIASLVLAAPDAPAENAPAPSPRLALRLAAGASAAAGAGFSGQTGMSVLPCAAVGVGAAAGAGAATEFSLSATELDSAWFADFLDLPLFAAARLHLANADLSGHWRQDGPLAATIKALARLEFPGDAATAFPAAPASPTATASPATPASPAVTASPIATAFPAATVSIDAKTAPDRIDIADFTLSENGVPVATATGRIPLVIHPRQTPAWRFDPAAPFEIDARTAPAGHFWQNLSSAIGITLENPSLHVRVSGSWRTPASTVDVSIDRLEFDPARWPANNLPPVTGLAASLSASAEAVQLDALSIRLAGQPLRASGRILAPKDGWQTLSRASLADFSKLPREFHIELPDTDVAAFAPYSSDLLIPRGHLNASLHLQPDGSLDGTLRLHDGALRPVGPLGAIRDIEIESRLAGRRIEITRATALVGGETLALTGSATLRPGAPPALDLAFRGKNIPFVRRSGFLMRGDIDLRALTDGGITRLAGDITLRDSLFLADIRALWPDTPGGGPASRPPFFSIDAPPFDDWRLDINVRGDRFLRLRTTLATGRLSANFQLGGTLGEPRSVGEITMSEGRVLFPFANFSVGTGRVRITQANPFTPSLDFRATTNTLGHDLTMSLTGAPDDPRLVFSSSPPLSSADILLLVMTGQSPDDGFAYTDQQRAFRLGTYLGQGILEQLLGLDMGEERLSLTSGDKVTRQGRETYKLEYKIDKRWTAVGEYDEFDDYNIGLKWRFYQSKPPKEKKNAP